MVVTPPFCEMGSWIDRSASFLGYPRSLVQVVAVRLQQAEIWYGNQVRSNSSVDPEPGQTALLLGLMVAEGTIIRAMVRRKVLSTLIEWHQTGPHQSLQFDEKAADSVGIGSWVSLR